MKRLFTIATIVSLVLTLNSITALSQADIRITAVYDGDLAGGTPKGVELYTCDPIPDLSQYGIASANNGAGPNAFPEYIFPNISVPAGTYFYVAYESVEFTNFFGSAPDETANAMLINGDDAIELFFGTTVIDVFGDVNQDGTGTAWDYTDGWAYRISGTGPDGNTFDINNWTFSGAGGLTGETTNASAANPVPVGTFSCTASALTATASGGDGCPGDLISFTGSASGGTSPYSYSWDFGDGSNSSSQSPTHFYSTSGTYSVTLTVTDGVGGTDNDVISVTVHPEPVVSFNHSFSNGGCAPEVVDFNDASTINSGTIVTWDWTFQSGTPSTATGQNPTGVSWSTAGSYMVTLTATSDQGCLGDAVNTITISPQEDASFSYPDSTLCSDDNSAYTATILGTTGGTFAATGGLTIDAATGEFTPSANTAGTYTVTYTTLGNCSDNSSIVIDILDCTSIDEKTEASVSIYPNPATNNVRLSFGQLVNGSVEVYDMIGAKVLTTGVNGSFIDLSVDALPAGNYFVRLISQDGMHTARFVKQ